MFFKLGEKKSMNVKPSSYTNIITYVLFTVVPIILFCTVLILKFKGNYGEKIKQAESKLSDCKGASFILQKELFQSEEESSNLKRVRSICKKGLKGLSDSWSKLTVVFKKNIKNLKKSEKLKVEVKELREKLDNATKDRDRLIQEIQKIKEDMYDLKSNTSRLQGEKEGLEKVLEVKTFVLKKDTIKKTATEVLEEQKRNDTEKAIKEIVKEEINELVGRKSGSIEEDISPKSLKEVIQETGDSLKAELVKQLSHLSNSTSSLQKATSS